MNAAAAGLSWQAIADCGTAISPPAVPPPLSRQPSRPCTAFLDPALTTLKPSLHFRSTCLRLGCSVAKTCALWDTYTYKSAGERPEEHREALYTAVCCAKGRGIDCRLQGLFSGNHCVVPVILAHQPQYAPTRACTDCLLPHAPVGTRRNLGCLFGRI